MTYVNKSLASVDHAYVEVKIPSGMQFVSADNNGIVSGNVITWDLGTLSAKEAGTLTFKLKVTASASSSDQNLRVEASIYSKGTLLTNTEDDTSFVNLLIQSADVEHYHKRYIKGYPDNTVRPYANITRGEIAAIFARIMNLKGTVTNKQVYSDVNVKHWAAEYIEAISAKKIFLGYPDGTFKPDQPITRAEFATVIARFLGIVKQQQLEDYIRLSGFTDTNKSWAAQNIEELFRYGIVAGYGDGTFKQDQNITRAESIKMINRMLYRGPLMDVESSFTDNKDKTAWFFGEIEEATRSHDYVYNDNGGENLIKYIPEPLW